MLRKQLRTERLCLQSPVPPFAVASANGGDGKGYLSRQRNQDAVSVAATLSRHFHLRPAPSPRACRLAIPCP
eukprot:6191131-Pleurochrysis_carterae.AAC.1